MLEIDENLQQTEPDSRAGSEIKPFLLRHPARTDLASLVALANNPALTKNLCSNWLPSSDIQADSWFLNYTEKSDPTEFPFIITDMKGTMIGVICLLLQENRKQAEISVMIMREHWQHGYATRAIQAVADFAFSSPNINQPSLEALEARCRVSCGRSRRIVEKCGFQYSGTGMAHSQHYKGMIPIDRYRLDRGVWYALRNWSGMGQSNPWAFGPNSTPRGYSLKGAA
ncbi:GNAT family N-acetyltransferase [uncultured Cohaesibacter sp.]|uniref:GNAT family N-acetyltransferase n=1 Tax=uncultured Cohaesibacter sp. TaxID=1002546 RepID=UPI0029C7C1AF|nr:GNAT family N-acetyltransferase [uncultured Cohaesibacter sp.]